MSYESVAKNLKKKNQIIERIAWQFLYNFVGTKVKNAR